MAHVLLIDDDPGTLVGFATILRGAGHDVVTAMSGMEGLDLLARLRIDLILSDLRLPDMSGIDVLRAVRDRVAVIPVIVITGFGTTKDTVAAMRLGAVDVVEKPVFEEDLLRAVETTLAGGTGVPAPIVPVNGSGTQEAHAAMRLARAIVPVLDARTDPKTIPLWSRLVAASPGALRNWCRTAGLSPRRALVFARLLRAVALNSGGGQRPENLLDAVDRRTLQKLLQLAGIDSVDDFPTDLDAFLNGQLLVSDPDILSAIRALIGQRSPIIAAGMPESLAEYR